MDYQGDFQYENGVLQFIAQPEGYIYKDATGYRYVYQYRDHLGNNRLSFMRNAGTVAIVKETNYYPFGLTQKGYNNLTTSLGSADAKKYQYNGKELQDDYGLKWYDYGARMYDASLGRWFVVDPLAEKLRRWSPYSYAVDDPIRFIDIEGNYIADANGKRVYNISKGWSKNAPANEVRIGNDMMITRVGRQQFLKMVSSNYPVQMIFAASPPDPGKFAHSKITVNHNLKGNPSSAILKIYKSNVKNLLKNLDRTGVKNPTQHPDQVATLNVYKGIKPTFDEAVGALASHESVHITDPKNREMALDNNNNVEKKPHAVERQFLIETPIHLIKPLNVKDPLYEYF